MPSAGVEHRSDQILLKNFHRERSSITHPRAQSSCAWDKIIARGQSNEKPTPFPRYTVEPHP